MSATDKTILIRCKQDGVPLILLSAPDGKVLAICPVCGSGANSEHVLKHSAGLIGGLIPEEQLIDLRKQLKIAQKGGS